MASRVSTGTASKASVMAVPASARAKDMPLMRGLKVIIGHLRPAG
jgi:hypothetical protein